VSSVDFCENGVQSLSFASRQVELASSFLFFQSDPLAPVCSTSSSSLVSSSLNISERITGGFGASSVDFCILMTQNSSGPTDENLENAVH
jgi:hypothetical protein